MGIFVCTTLPSEQFDGTEMAIPVTNIQQLSRRGSHDKVWLIFWLEGKTTKRPLEGTWEENLTALHEAS